MRVALISESSADEPALRILTEAILGEVIEVEQLRVRSRGWQSVFKNLRSYLAALHYGGADGAVILLDSDDTELHDNSHGPDFPRGRCRLCDLTRDADHITQPVHARRRPVPAQTRDRSRLPAHRSVVELAGRQADHGGRLARRKARGPGSGVQPRKLESAFLQGGPPGHRAPNCSDDGRSDPALWPVGRIRALVPGRFRAATS
jgi:hypothetical protein